VKAIVIVTAISDEEKRLPGFEKKREEETRDDTAELATKKRSPGFSRKK